MTATISLLEDILKGVTMGIISLEHLNEKTDDTDFKKAISVELEEYRKLANDAKTAIRATGHEPVGLGKIPKKASEISVNTNSKSDSSTEHYAQMIINGSTMGINKLSRQLRRFSCKADENATALARKTLETELKNISSMLEYI